MCLVWTMIMFIMIINCPNVTSEKVGYSRSCYVHTLTGQNWGLLEDENFAILGTELEC